MAQFREAFIEAGGELQAEAALLNDAEGSVGVRLTGMLVLTLIGLPFSLLWPAKWWAWRRPPTILGLIILSVLLTFPPASHAEMEKLASKCDTGICFQWWPKLPAVPGWHQDRAASLRYSLNAQVPDGKSFTDASFVIYAKAEYKPREPELTSVQAVIESDQNDFRGRAPGIEIREVEPLSTADGQKLRTFAYLPPAVGDWEEVSYGEEGDFYLIFAVSSHSKEGLAKALADYRQFIHRYRSNP